MPPTKNCTDDEYFDEAPGMCVPCERICHHPDEQQKQICQEKCPLFNQESSQIVTEAIASTKDDDGTLILKTVLPIVGVILVVTIVAIIVVYKKFHETPPPKKQENEEGPGGQQLDTIDSHRSAPEPELRPTDQPNGSANDPLLPPASNQSGSAQRVQNGGASQSLLVTHPASAGDTDEPTQVKQPLQPDSTGNPVDEGGGQSGLSLPLLVTNPVSDTYQQPQAAAGSAPDDDDITQVKQRAQRHDDGVAEGETTYIANPEDDGKAEFAPTGK